MTDTFGINFIRMSDVFDVNTTELCDTLIKSELVALEH